MPSLTRPVVLSTCALASAGLVWYYKQVLIDFLKSDGGGKVQGLGQVEGDDEVFKDALDSHAPQDARDEDAELPSYEDAQSEVKPSAGSTALSDKTNVPLSPPAIPKKQSTKVLTPKSRKKIQFAAGCFWSVELAFQRVPGVISTRVGYTQGETRDPKYEDVKTGNSGHAE